jgi:hypothetical protein
MIFVANDSSEVGISISAGHGDIAGFDSALGTAAPH